MRYLLLCFFCLSTLNATEETSESQEEVARTAFPVRLTEQEQEEEAYRMYEPSPCGTAPAPASGCCNPPDPNACVQKCCKPPSINCPPLRPLCDPCDCIIDYFNPLVFNGFDIYLEWLFWNVQQKSSTYVLKPNAPQLSNTVADAIGEYKSAEFDWNSGVRLGLAYTFQRDAWNLLGQYTYYGTKGTSSVTRPNNPMFYLEPTLRGQSASEPGINRSRSNTDFQYQVFDLLLSRRFLPGCQILFDFFAGPTAAVITEKWKVRTYDVHNILLPVTTTTRNRWSYASGGMRVGFNANWHIGNGWGLYNRSSFASYVGAYYNRRRTSIEPSVNQSLQPRVRNTKEDETWVVPTTQLEFGLNWNHRFCNWAVMIQGAFEVNTWYDLHQLHQDSQNLLPPNVEHLDYRNASPVSLWGFNFRVNFSF